MRSLLLAVSLVLLLVSAACAPRAQAAQRSSSAPRAVRVRLVAVTAGPVDHPIRASGHLVAKNVWDLGFKVGGVLAAVDVGKGDRIRKGQVLARLDPTELLAGARQVRVALEKARRDSDRMAMLVAKDSAPRTAADDLQTAREVAEAQLIAAEFNLRHATLVAPESGWVEDRMAEAGEVVSPGRPVLRVSGVGRGFVVRAALADRDVLGLGQGTQATVTLDAAPEHPLVGQVTEIGRAAGSGTGTYEVEIALTMPPGAPVLSGLTAKVEIARTLQAEGAVPLAAVVDGDGETGAVFVVKEGVARRVSVRIALLQGERAVLSSGIAGIERVVTDGAPRLSDGARVEVVE